MKTKRNKPNSRINPNSNNYEPNEIRTPTHYIFELKIPNYPPIKQNQDRNKGVPETNSIGIYIHGT